MSINDAQKKAIKHFKGPILVLAGPGSGKTFVITRRTKYLIEQYGVDPRRILVITFTKAAAEEMKERFNNLMNGENQGVNFGTFHAIFFKILKYAYNYSANNIIREEERYGYFREMIGQLDMEIEDEKDFIEGITGEISMVKCERMDIDHYYSLNCSEEIFKKIYEGYENRLRRANQIDFDDMLVLCYELLIARPDILRIWQQQYNYIMIDEAQDSNALQYEITRLLAGADQNIAFVGDDDQSLYRFRGAKPEIMLNYNKDYPEGERVYLDLNYRSQSKIVEGALRVIKNNSKRYPKNTKAVRDAKDDIQVQTFKTIQEENKMVLDEVRRYQENGISLNHMAVLFRTNAQPRALIELFMEYNIPFKMKDAIPNIYEHWVSQNIITYIRIALGQMERGLFLQIINRPKRYIARNCFEEPMVSLEAIKRYYHDKDYVIERIQKLEYDLKMLCQMNPYAAINYIRRGIGYEDYLREYADYRRIKVEELMDVLNELQESAKKYETYNDWFEHMDEYKLELKEQAELRKHKNMEGVAMMTFHGAKGLEYEVVFVIDANESITPHRKALTQADIEEERRMFYVAMTRAKTYLHIYSVKERYNKELECSRFVGELLIDSEALIEGARIEHKMYGQGTIVKIKENIITIKFDRIVLAKKLDLDFCIRNHMIQA